MRGIALALGASPDEFEGERGGDAFWMVRLNGYPGISLVDGQDVQENEIGWYVSRSTLIFISLEFYYLGSYDLNLFSYFFLCFSVCLSGIHTDYGKLSQV